MHYIITSIIKLKCKKKGKWTNILSVAKGEQSHLGKVRQGWAPHWVWKQGA